MSYAEDWGDISFVVNVLNNLHNQCVFHKGSCGRTEARSKTRKKKEEKEQNKKSDSESSDSDVC